MTIKHGVLTDYFSGIGFKRLSSVEVDPETSNEHEFNGISKFKELFGLEKQVFAVRLIYLCDNEEDISEDATEFTWYDARAAHPTRSEHRLYYKNSGCIEKAEPQDLMVICLNNLRAQSETKSLTVFIAKNGDTIERQLAWLFGIQLDTVTDQFSVPSKPVKSVDFFTGLILERVGVPVADANDGLLGKLLAKFPSGFPTTHAFSAFAREDLCSDVSVLDDVDAAIVAWIEAEETAFRVLENHLVKGKIEKGFSSVDDFVNYSLSIHNRRKSRAGFALENHLKFAFSALKIHYSYNEITENKSRPDFIFPGIKEYRDPSFSSASLTMLGVKTTCKDRWRQVLSEAQRIENKHLLTFEPSISIAQTDEMRASKLHLVVPKEIVKSYTTLQQSWLLNISDFVIFVKEKQAINR